MWLWLWIWVDSVMHRAEDGRFMRPKTGHSVLFGEGLTRITMELPYDHKNNSALGLYMEHRHEPGTSANFVRGSQMLSQGTIGKL
jgi:hypothetical protein